jgi:hypothetical protein
MVINNEKEREETAENEAREPLLRSETYYVNVNSFGK